jgi:PAS domain S-box-containing protein
MEWILLIISFAALSIGTIVLYFLLFSRQKERFILYSGFSWFAYLFSLMCIVGMHYTDFYPIYGVREICDMLNIFFLMFSAFAFVRLEIPTYWVRATLILVIWLVIGSVYRVDIRLVFLPISIYELVCTFVICHTILKYWSTDRTEKGVSFAFFFIWGVAKAVIPLVIHYDEMPLIVYFSEILFYNLLYYSLIVIYMHESVKRLTRSEKNFRIITENAADTIFFYVQRPMPAFTYISPSAEAMTGYRAQDFYADPRFYLKLVNPEDFERITKIFDFHENQSAPETPGNLICQMIRADGRHFWTEMRHALLYEDGKPSAIVGIIRDISPMKSVEEELIKSKRSRERLFSYISHELRLPLSSIIGYVDAIRDGTIIEREKGAALSIISEKAHSLNHLIDDLSQLSQLETGRFAFNFMLCDIGELAAGMMISHASDIAGKNLRFNNRLEHSPHARYTVVADPERIGQILSNLIENAAKFSKPDQTITVEFGLDNAKRLFTMAVSDCGRGISPADIPRVFDRFFTKSDAKSGHPGTGIGLTLSKEIAEAHKGNLRVSSIEGKGSVFTLSIPLYKEK